VTHGCLLAIKFLYWRLLGIRQVFDWNFLMTRLIFVLAFKVEWLTPSVHTKAFRWLYIYFYQVMCAIILLVLELYLQVTPCSIYHAESFLKGLHSRFFFTCLQICSYTCMLCEGATGLPWQTTPFVVLLFHQNFWTTNIFVGVSEFVNRT
jgi:hypothetical protein